MEGRRLGKNCSKSLIKLTKGNSLSIEGFNLEIRGNIGNSLMVFGVDGCIKGRFRLLVHDCFLNLTKVCGIFLYLMFHSYSPSNSVSLSITYISSILFSILSPSPTNDYTPWWPNISIESYYKSLPVVLPGMTRLDLSEP